MSADSRETRASLRKLHVLAKLTLQALPSAFFTLPSAFSPCRFIFTLASFHLKMGQNKTATVLGCLAGFHHNEETIDMKKLNDMRLLFLLLFLRLIIACLWLRPAIACLWLSPAIACLGLSLAIACAVFCWRN